MAIESMITMAAAIIKVVWEFIDQYAKDHGLPKEELRKKVLQIAKEHDKSAEELLKLIKKTENE